MLDENYLNLFGMYIKLSQQFGGLPYTWDAENLTLTANKRTRLKYLLSTSLMIGSLIWYIFVVYQAVLVDDKSTEILGLVFILAMLLGSKFACVTLINHKRSGNFFRTVFKFTLHYQKTYVLSHRWMIKKNFMDRIRKHFLIMSAASVIFFPLAITLHYLLFPSLPFFIASLFVNTRKIIFVPILISTSYVYWLVGHNMTCTVMLYDNMTVNYAMTVYPILCNELRINRPSYRTIRQLREPPTLTTFYRGVEILTKEYNHMYRPLFVAAHMLVTQFILVAIFGLILAWNEMDNIIKSNLFIIAVMAILVWGTILQFGGWLLNNSRKTVYSWKYFPYLHPKRKFLSKFRKSCRPLGLRVDENYGQLLVRKKSVLKFIKSIIKGTLNGLLALDE